MNKFDKMKEYLESTLEQGEERKISFEEFSHVAGVAPDHSFLQYKKELAKSGIEVKKISMKEKYFIFYKDKE